MATSASSSLPVGYSLHSGYPSAAEYLRLRAASGLSPRTAAQAAGAISGSWHGCYIKYTSPDSTTEPAVIVGMGRIIGDGAWYFHIADMAVRPDHQRRGLGDAILKHLLGYIKANAAEGQYLVNLFADPPGRRLYRKNGFTESSALDEIGMVSRNAD